MTERNLAEGHAERVYQLHQVRSIVTQLEELARVLERAGKLLNNSVGMDDRSRKLLRQSWEVAGELFNHLAGLLNHGQVGTYPLQSGAGDGSQAVTDHTTVADALREIWSKIQWMQEQDRASQVRFSLERIGQELSQQAKSLGQLIENAPQSPAQSTN